MNGIDPATPLVIRGLIFPRLDQFDFTGPFEVLAQVPNSRFLVIAKDHEPLRDMAGLRIVADTTMAEAPQLDVLLVPCGGGGLLAGSALSAGAMSPGCRVIGVEPAAGDDATRSFRTGQLQTVNNPKTVADGARTPSLGALTFPLVLKHVGAMATVDDPTLLKTMFYLWERLKLVVEPTGALGAAAALEGTTPIRGLRVGVILSGGNVDLAQVGGWIQYR